MFYEYKGNLYLVTDECSFKDPVTRQWFDAFIYQPIVDSKVMGVKYVREKKEFLSRFNKVNIQMKGVQN